MYRLRHHELRYKKARHLEKDCPFCGSVADRLVKKTKYFYIIKNIYGYDLWDRRKVVEHLLIIPKKHQIDLKKITGEAAIEYTKLLTNYIDKGYDVYTRTTNAQTKSQTHFHTHLIKATGKLARIVHFNEDPYYIYIK